MATLIEYLGFPLYFGATKRTTSCVLTGCERSASHSSAYARFASVGETPLGTPSHQHGITARRSASRSSQAEIAASQRGQRIRPRPPTGSLIPPSARSCLVGCRIGARARRTSGRGGLESGRSSHPAL